MTPAGAIEGVLLTTDYLTVGERAWIRLWIAGEQGATPVLDPTFEPYFYAVPSLGTDVQATAAEIEGTRAGDAEVHRCETVTLQEGLDPIGVVRVVARHPQDVPALRRKIRGLETVGSTREDDVLFANRYLIDKGLVPLTWTRVETKKSEQRPDHVELVDAEQDAERDLDLHVLAFDLEVYNPKVTPNPDQDPIIVASLADNRGHQETLTKPDDDSDRMLIATLAKRIRDLDPDVIVTYNGDNFDWPYLLDRAQVHGIDVRVGRDGSPPNIRQAGRDKAVTLTGRGNVDGYQMAQRDLPDVKVKTLERVAEHLGVVDEGGRTDLDSAKMAEIWDDADQREELLAYAIDDATSALGIGEELLPLQIRLCRRTYQDLSDGSRMGRGRQADWYLLAEAHRRGIIAPDKRHGFARSQQYEGGVVLEPPAGIHEDVVYLDFSSMYPSIMVAYNVSPDTYLPPDQAPDGPVHEAPDVGHRFRTEPDGFFKRILQELLSTRQDLKGEMAVQERGSQGWRTLKVEEQAIKVLTNAFYGYMGWGGARWQSVPCAEATTAWGRHFVQRAAEMARDLDLEVLYGDSVTAERLVTVRDPSGAVQPMTVEDLFERAGQGAIEQHGSKEVARPEGYQALSVDPETQEACWSPIQGVIRHAAGKPIYRVWQKHGETRVTEDHGLMTLGEGGLARTRPEDVGLRDLFRVEGIQRGPTPDRIDLLEILEPYGFELHVKGKTRNARAYPVGDRIAFGWQNRRDPITIPRYVDMGSEAFEALCRLVGAYVAEGSASTPETTDTRMGASIASADQAWLEQLQADYHLLFENAKGSIIRSTRGIRELEREDGSVLAYEDKTQKLQMMNQLAAVFFRQLCGQTSEGKRLPAFVFNIPEAYQRIVLDTMVQGDGSTWPDPRYTDAYHDEQFSYTTKSLPLISGLCLMLGQLGVHYSLQYRQEKETYTLKTSSKPNNSLETRIREEPYEGYVYDLEVEGTNTFVDACGQILLHNTDSVMILDAPEIQAYIDEVNRELPVELEVEARFEVLFFTGAKKRYAGRTREGETIVRGLEVRRGDWCAYAKRVQQEVIDALLESRDPEEAKRIGIDAVQALRDGEVPVEELSIHKTLTMAPEDYQAKQPHSVAVEHAQANNPGFQAPVGSKIGYVIVKDKSDLISERARLLEFLDPDDAVDDEYYIENQVIPAAHRVLAYFGVSKDELAGRPSQASLQDWF